MPNAPKTFRWVKQGKTVRPVDDRPQSQDRGYDADWVKFRKWFRIQNPLCVVCGHPGECVDHIIPIAAGGSRLDAENCQTLCWQHHSAKTAKEDGGFGRTAKTR